MHVQCDPAQKNLTMSWLHAPDQEHPETFQVCISVLIPDNSPAFTPLDSKKNN
jgi:hypothetical protein